MMLDPRRLTLDSRLSTLDSRRIKICYNTHMNFSEPIILGRTGLKAGRLGIASGYGAPAVALEEAFERGCNYFTWGTFILGRSSKMREAIRHIVHNGHRDKLIIAMLSYAHQAFLTEHFFVKGLQDAGIEYADFLMLGSFSKHPPQKIIDGALRMKEKGLCRFIGLTSHNRKIFPELHNENIFDLFHVRYNAVHRGAETETFPFLQGESRPGVVAFTATCWGRLLKASKMPADEPPPSAVDCYRFVLSNPAVDVCLTGTKTIEQMRQNLAVLDSGPMMPEELARLRKIGMHMHKK